MWSLQSSSIGSGQFQLTSSENETPQKAFNDRDLLLDICGEYSIGIGIYKQHNRIQIKEVSSEMCCIESLEALEIGEQHI